MLFVSAAEDPANPVGKLVSAQQPLGLNYLAFAADPLGLYCVEPGALDGQQTWNYPDPTVAGFDPAVMDDDPLSYLMALVPTSVVPDKKQSLLTPLLELLAAPPEEPCGYGAHRPTVYDGLPSTTAYRLRISARSLPTRAHKAHSRREPSARDRPFSPLSQGDA